MGGYGEEFSLDDADGDIVELEVVVMCFCWRWRCRWFPMEVST